MRGYLGNQGRNRPNNKGPRHGNRDGNRGNGRPDDQMLPDLEPIDRPGLEGLIDRYEQRRRDEDAHIHALFARLEQEAFASRFEAWVAKHTGIDVDELQPAPPGER